MAQYDGSIRINTKIDTKGFKDGEKEIESESRRLSKSVSNSTQEAEKSVENLSQTFSETAVKIAELQTKMELLKNQKIPTEEYTNAQNSVEKLHKSLEDAYTRKERFLEAGGDESSRTFKGMEYDIEKLEIKLRQAEEDVKSLVDSGRDFTLGVDTEQFAKMEAQMSKLQTIRDKEIQQENEKQAKLQVEAAEEERLAQIRENAVVGNQHIVQALEQIKQLEQEIADLKKAGVTEGYKDYDERIRKLSQLKQTVKDYNASISQTKGSYKKLSDTAKQSFDKINKSTKKSGGLLGTMATRFKGLALSLLIFNQISKAFNAMTSGIKQGFDNFYKGNERFRNSVDSLKANLLTLKNSFSAAFAPLVQTVIPYIQKAVEWITMLINKVGQLIAAVSGQKTYTKAVGQTADAFKDAKKAAEGYLSPLDEINKFQSSDEKTDSEKEEEMFEEVPIDSKFIEKANRIKEILSQLFQPLKTAWENQGQFVMDSWKYALEEVGLLAQSVGKDFLEVWNQPETISVLENILIIVGDIGLVVGNLTARFREAWEANDVGLHILENIRNIFGIIIEHIRNAEDATVEWSKNLDFSPMLESINGLLEALQPLADNIGAGLEWFYTNVLLPIAGWTIEEAIPTFLNMLSAAIGAANEVIEALKPLGQWLWDEFLQPLGKWAGETVISAMETITNLLQRFGEWVSEHQEAVQNLTIIIGAFAVAWGVVSTAVGIWNGIATIASAVTTAFGAAVAFLTSPIGIAIAAIGAIIAIGVLLYKNWDEISAKAKEVWEFVKNKFKEFSMWLKEVFEKDWTEVFGVFGGTLNGFLDIVIGIWNSIKQIFGGIIDFIAGVFTGDWERAWDGVVNIFKGIFNLIPTIVEGILNTAIGIINGLIGGINTITGVVGIPEIPKIPEVSIPRLATGTVVPPNREFMAVLGDNKHEPEVVSPISTMKQAVLEAIAEVGGMGEKEITIKVPIYLDGKVIYEAVINQGKINQMSSGSNGFLLGVT